MFINVETNAENMVSLNTSQICYLDGNNAQMSNGFTVFLTDKSLKEVQDSLFGDVAEPKNGASEHTVQLLNELYKLCGGKGEAKPTSDRKARLKSRLKDFSEDELKKAATNLGQDDFMQGENDSNKRYGTLDYLLRTSANVNKWVEDQPQKKKPGMF